MKKHAHNFKDLTGQRFTRLLVIEFAYVKNGNSYWKCKCDCGTEKIILGSNLKIGQTKSCGCMRKEFKDLTGKQYGWLKVLNSDHVGKFRSRYWKCLCVCGNITIVLAGHLKDGHTKSCGCMRNEKGFKHTEKSKRRMSKAQKGKKRSAECIKDMSKRMKGRWTGVKNPNYNPNLTPEDRINRRYIPGYKEWVQAVFERDNYTCQICGDNTGGNLIAHHLESYRDNKELRTKLSNGATVCEKHHLDFHHRYGYGHNTRKQFEKFKEEFQRGVRNNYENLLGYVGRCLVK